ncbi:diphthamide biosynthesis protein 2 [Aphanomyces invadans]|uniref:2-(3-amino-3-carboxypropyl)histidine synthase subunit 2 n=1 Tax=Aphanomyces invadans TaxID=157072 RepID=A0A024UCW3_9STRA|nr:diphthamide biosynthesis protein 2 [Aphanomyces invadans]ETW03438.1 diphthamide biosynthesis protein 2 [Aphanomyces invadans]|eukprot:XP_008867667.1 diphthamide biosynthesis protein 2 [Aphanomyces invadans]
MASTGFAVDDGSRIMQQSVHIHTSTDSASAAVALSAVHSDITSFYSIDKTAEHIQNHGFRRIALQFPDSMLPDSIQVQKHLCTALASRGYPIERIFVLGDTSYGSCCVDEVAGHHLLADCVVHYGRACLSPTSSLPVIYVFGNVPSDAAEIAAGFTTVLASVDASATHVLLYEPCYEHQAAAVAAALRSSYPHLDVLCSTMRTIYHPDTLAAEGEPFTFIGGLTIPLSPSRTFSPSTVLLYVGTESPHLTNILLRAGDTVCVSYDPQTKVARREGTTINRTLNRRYFLVQKAKEAQIIGILMGTLGVANCLNVVQKLQTLIAKSGRKSYTFVVGKINVPKLSNFAEIDVFCLVACAENSLLDNAEFFKPIVTPYELHLALTHGDSEWSGQYKADFQEVLPSLVAAADDMEDEGSPDEPYFSLVTGKYHQNQRHGTAADCGEGDDMEGTSSTALVSKAGTQQLTTYRSEAGEFLATREYRGLEPPSFIALAFQNFSLPPGDFILLRQLALGTLSPLQLPPVRLDSMSYRGSFVAPPLSTTSVSIELYTNSSSDAATPPTGRNVVKPCRGEFEIIGYNTHLEGGNGKESVCGTDESIEVACFNDINPIHRFMYLRSGAIARLIIQRGQSLFGCTGWLIGTQGHLVTNNHCIQDAADAANTRIEFLAQATLCPDITTSSGMCDRQMACPGEIYSNATKEFVTTSVDLDYTLIRLDPSVVGRYGMLKLRAFASVVGEPVYSVTHPLAWGKRMQYKKNGSLAAVVAMGKTELQYMLDTRKMSSGSPILSLQDHSVVALHHAGLENCPNFGVRSDIIVKDLRAKKLLPDNSTIDG